MAVAELPGTSEERRRARWCASFLVLVTLASLPFLVHPWYDATNDGSMYIACARALLAHGEYAYLGEPFTVRPPGMAVAIAPLIALWGTDFAVLNVYCGLFGVAAVLLFFVLQRGRLGIPLALLAALLLWLNPGIQRYCGQVMSDVPGVALLLGALVYERWAARRPSLRREIGLGLLVAVATYMRTINFLLVPAILLARVLARPRGDGRPSWRAHAGRSLLPFAAVAILALLPWSLRNAAVAKPPPADQTYVYSYTTGMLHEDPGDPSSPRLSAGDVLRRVPRRARQMAEVMGSRMQRVIPSHHRFVALGDARRSDRAEHPVHLAFGSVLLASALVMAIRRRRASDLFALLAMVVLWLYFGFDDRLVLPVFVLCLGTLLELLREGAGKLAGARAGAWSLGLGLVALIAVDFHPRRDWDLIRAQHEAYETMREELEPVLAADARLAAPIGWHLGVYLERPVHSLHWIVRRSGEPRAAEPLLDAYAIDTVLLSPLVPTDRAALTYFQERYEKVRRAGSVYVVEVR